MRQHPAHIRSGIPRARTQPSGWVYQGDDPATSFEFQDGFDAYGQPTGGAQVACPRGFKKPADTPAGGETYLTTHSSREYAQSQTPYIVDRVAKTQTHELQDDGTLTLKELKSELATKGTHSGAVEWEIQSETINYYDGTAYQGLAAGQIGDFGARTASKTLVVTDAIVDEAYPSGSDAPDQSGKPAYLTADSPSWPAAYPDEFQNRIDGLSGRAGYIHESGNYYVWSDRTRYDFQDSNASTSKGLVTGRKDPLGNETTIEWDGSFNYLPKQVTDPQGMVREATYDTRTFKPHEVTSPNDNRTRMRYTPLGMVKTKAVMGKSSETKGDTLAEPGTEYTYDLKAFDTSQEPVSVTSIQRVHHTNASYSPSAPDETIKTVEYSDGFGRKAQTRVQAEDLDFSDAGMGSGSITDDFSGSAPASGDPRVRVTGWKRYDNDPDIEARHRREAKQMCRDDALSPRRRCRRHRREVRCEYRRICEPQQMSDEYVRVSGNVVEKWEPFFSEGFDFEDVATSPTGQSVQMHYDARGRTVRPDGGQNRVIFGVPGSIGAPDITTPGSFEPTPWERYTYDATDNAGRTPVDAPSEHHDTPTSVVFDAKGRTIKTVERNGRSSSDKLVTQTDYDIRGNVTKVIDPEGRDAAAQVFDLADNKLRTESIDAGHSVSVFDAAGISIETRDAKGGLSLKRADNLGRTTHVWGRDGSGESVRLCERVIFGDAAGGPSSPKDDNHYGPEISQSLLLRLAVCPILASHFSTMPPASPPRTQSIVSNTLRCLATEFCEISGPGKPYRHYDEAGRVNFEAYDFKGKQIQAHIFQKTPSRGTAECAKRGVKPWTRCRRHRGNVRHEIRAFCKPQ